MNPPGGESRSPRPATASGQGSVTLPPEVHRALASPQRRAIGRYLIIDELGRGGMGAVYRGFDPGLQRLVAIKLLLAREGAGDAERTRLVNEARAAARLQHPGIVAVHEVGVHGGQPFLVMDLVEGETFERLLKRERPSPRRIAEVVREVASALEHAHGLGVVHRDIKPENILIDAEGRARVADFGLARDLHAEGLTVSGQIVGTPGYMAPEQADADRASIGPPCDVWALGAVLYRGLVGRPPFRGTTVLATVMDILQKEPDAPRRIDPSIHIDLETIALRCLEKDAARRYPGARAVADELGRFLDGAAIEARPLGRIERARRWARQRRLAATGIVALALAVVFSTGAGAWALVEVRRRVAAERAAELEEHRARAMVARDRFEKARHPPLDAETPRQRRDREDRALAAGLDALAAALTLHALAPQDADALGSAHETAMAMGHVALAAEQWSVAVSAFEKAAGLEVKPEVAVAAIAQVTTARDRAASDRRAKVRAILEEATSGSLAGRPLRQSEAVIELVALGSEETASILIKAVDDVAAELRRSASEVLAAGDPALPELAEAADRWRSLALGAKPDRADRRALEAAVRAIARRAPADLTKGKPPSWREDIAVAQLRQVGERITLAQICCETLGHLRRVDAIEPIARYLFAIADEHLAMTAGEALCRIGDARGVRLALEVIDHPGSCLPEQGPYSRRLRTILRSSPDADSLVAAPLEVETPEALHERAWAREMTGDLEGASADWSRALELDPTFQKAWHNRGLVKQRLGDLPGSLADLGRALELAPTDPVTIASHGAVLAMSGRPTDAIAALERATRLDPQFAEGWAVLGQIRATQGDLRRARADLDRAIALEPRSSQTLGTRGQIRLELGDVRGAIVDLSAAIDADPMSGHAWRLRGRALAATGDPASALADLDRAIELGERDAGTLHARGVARHRLGQLEGARADFDRVLELEPRHLNALRLRSLVRHGFGQLAEAEADLDLALSLDPRDPGTLSNRGGIRKDRGDLAGALEDFDRALALDPRFAAAHFGRAIVHAAAGRHDAAEEDLGRGLSLWPDYPGAPKLRATLDELRR